jgi:NAD(P)-dependent dehydrogenase (short-subunit alcohol dehydrogenase family)
MQLQDRVCVITGAARGLGAAIVRDLHARGARVLVSDIEEATLEEMKKLGVETMRCNVTDREQVVALGRAAIERFGRIDVWINNAGIWSPYVKALETDMNRAHLLMDVNYFGTAYGMLEALKHMEGREGIICNILSVRSLKGKSMAGAYCASKFAAEGFTQAVRDEMQDSEVRIIGIYPYRMKTELFGENKHADYDASMEPEHVAQIIVDNLAKDMPSDHVEIWSHSDIRTK